MSTPRALSILSRSISRSSRHPLLLRTPTPRLSLPAVALSLRSPSALHFSSRAPSAAPSQSIPTSDITSKSAAESEASSLQHLTDAEKRVHASLVAGLAPSALTVQDISGGCGSMFAIEISSEMFRGVGVLAQQRMVNKLLREQMDEEGWHGVQIKTTVG